MANEDSGQDPIAVAKGEHAAKLSTWQIIGRIAATVVVASVLLCVFLAWLRSTALTQITVTAIDPKAEPSDHQLPFVKQKEALPDYELFVIRQTDVRIDLGVRPDRSAAGGLEWNVPEPVSVRAVLPLSFFQQHKYFLTQRSNVFKR